MGIEYDKLLYDRIFYSKPSHRSGHEQNAVEIFSGSGLITHKAGSDSQRLAGGRPRPQPRSNDGQVRPENGPGSAIVR